jgi:xylan 1,4-beta-xylosidase
MNLRAAKQIPSAQLFLQNCENLSNVIREEGYGDVECIISEADPDAWAAGGRYDNFNLNFRNTEYYASWVASTYYNLQELAAKQGVDMRPLAWAFEFEHERLFEGTRAFDTHGIDKALMNLFRLYAKLGDERVELISERGFDPLSYKDKNGYDFGTEINGWATKTRGGYAVLLYAHHDDWDVDEEFSVKLRITGLHTEQVKLTHYRIDGEHSNAYAEWVRQGSPDWASEEQYAAIAARSGLELLCEPYAANVTDGEVECKFIMPSHGISFIEIRSC